MRRVPSVAAIALLSLSVSGCGQAGGASGSAAAGLVGTTWVLDSLLTGSGPDDDATSAQTSAQTSVQGDAELALDPDGTFTYGTGCNLGGGTYTRDDATVRFAPEESTSADCGEVGFSAMQDDHVRDVLGGEATITVEEDRLTVATDDRVLVYRAAPEHGLAAVLAGTAWRLERMVDDPDPDADGPILDLAEDADEAQLEFFRSGSARQGSGCAERDDVTYQVVDDHLISSYRAVIDYECDSDARWRQDRRVWAVLRAEPAVHLDGDELVLSNLDLSLHYTRLRGS